MADHFQVRNLHNTNPKLNAKQIAARLDCMPEYVHATARRLGLTLPGCKPRARKPDTIDQLGRAARLVGLTVDDIMGMKKS